MQADIEVLDVVCKHFDQYRNGELAELRKVNRRLRKEVSSLSIRLAINSALLEAWLRWRRVQTIAD